LTKKEDYGLAPSTAGGALALTGIHLKPAGVLRDFLPSGQIGGGAYAVFTTVAAAKSPTAATMAKIANTTFIAICCTRDNQ
jgi:hypothetical protein